MILPYEEYVLNWTKTGLLDDLSSDSAKNKMAVLLETTSWGMKELKNDNPTNSFVELWGHIALPIVRRAMGPFVELDTFHVMELPVTLFPYPETPESVPVVAKTQPLNIEFNWSELLPPNDNHYLYLEAEAETLAVFCELLKVELDTMLSGPVMFYQLRMLTNGKFVIRYVDLRNIHV